MANQWCNKQSILNDLVEITQGKVPVDLSRCITAGKPQAYSVKEETEEEYFQYCSGDVNFSRPDLASISEMLSMVQQVEDDPPEFEANTGQYVTITKLKTAEVISEEDKTRDEEIERLTLALKTKINTAPKTAKGRGERNVALASLLKVQAGVIPASFKKDLKAGVLLDHSTRNRNNNKEGAPIVNGVTNSIKAKAKVLEFKARIGEFDACNKNKVTESNVTVTDTAVEAKTEIEQMNTAKDNKVKLLKPEDFMPTSVSNNSNVESIGDKNTTSASKIETESDEKVKNCISRNVRKGPVLSATSMFKRKAPKTPSNIPTVDTQTSPKPKSTLNSTSYVPTPLATEYYNKFKEMADVKKAMKEDIWTQAEKKMKEIEEKNKMAAEVKMADAEETKVEENNIEASSSDDKEIPQYIYLPQHRHLLADECVVCRVLCKNDDNTSLPAIPSSTNDDDDDAEIIVLSD
ncbi:uncharacterized protein LOC105392262 [Plutella xylostella]|uniref:uncharacterized protein LOC105392262 n=1 Tax=Plutella xylostella TaxID=51655 RepID=UPI0020328EE5|nr:uncharacterized protein LOC105392262 [Plutella xylostella]